GTEQPLNCRRTSETAGGALALPRPFAGGGAWSRGPGSPALGAVSPLQQVFFRFSAGPVGQACGVSCWGNARRGALPRTPVAAVGSSACSCDGHVRRDAGNVESVGALPTGGHASARWRRRCDDEQRDARRRRAGGTASQPADFAAARSARRALSAHLD